VTSPDPAAIELLAEARLLAIVVIDDPSTAEPLGQALSEAGIRCVEVTLRTPAALQCMRLLAERGDMCVGAGTVLRAAQVHEVVAAGAGFVVSPGTSAAVVQACQSLGVPVLPGVATASEVQTALDLGIREVKFFPAEPMGGAATIAALSSPFPEMRFVPTGGISQRALPKYLASSSVLAVGGSWIATRSDLVTKDFATIRRRAAAAVDLVSQHPH
jgi:2-dehydro-3-deoxyphosphogluconate aldolase/(4S)-4-hydroxy-2-oxoglutarate aldolase